jgi:hypothetical protein
VIILILLYIIIVNSYFLNSTNDGINLVNSTGLSSNYSAKEQSTQQDGGGSISIGIYIGGGVAGGIGTIILFIIICCCCC